LGARECGAKAHFVAKLFFAEAMSTGRSISGDTYFFADTVGAIEKGDAGSALVGFDGAH